MRTRRITTSSARTCSLPIFRRMLPRLSWSKNSPQPPGVSLRARRQETLILQKLAGDEADCDTAFATAFVEKPKDVARLTRYITSIERAYYRALNKLEQIQKERVAAEKKKAAFELAAFEYHTFPSEAGFVSQPQPIAMAVASQPPTAALVKELRS